MSVEVHGTGSMTEINEDIKFYSLQILLEAIKAGYVEEENALVLSATTPHQNQIHWTIWHCITQIHILSLLN